MIDHMSYFWLVVAAILFILEIATPTTILIFPALAALLTAFVALFVDQLVVQSVLFFIVTVIFIVMIRPLINKDTKHPEYKSGVDALIGTEVRVVETIDNTKNQGKIKSSGDIFMAVSIDDVIIPEGTKVIVVDIKGIKLFVKKKS
ncbi:MAG: NfeD family protein [Brevinema sp.]